MRRKIIGIGIIVLGFAGCVRFKNGEGDMPYKIIEDKSGETIKEGEVVELTIMAKTEEDSVVWNSADYYRPALVKREKSLFKGDLFAALGLLSQGDSAVVKINIDSMEIKMGVPRPGSTKGRYLVYSMRIEHVVPKGKLSDSLYSTEVDKFLEARLEKLKIEEPVKIKAFIAGRHWDSVVVTGSGLQYNLIQKGSGLVPMPGDTMEVKYTCMLMSGKVISSTRPDVARITYGMYGTTRGFNEMLMLMPKGSIVKAIIPSALAYGKEGRGRDMAIQAYTPLVYEMEMVDIIHSHDKLAGRTMPDFRLYRLDATPFEKANVKKGRKSVVVVFDTDCDHCQNEVISIDRQYQAFRNVNLYLVSENSTAQIRTFMKTYGKGLENKENVTILEDKDRSFTTQFLPEFEPLRYPAIYVYSSKEELINYWGGQTDIQRIIDAVK